MYKSYLYLTPIPATTTFVQATDLRQKEKEKNEAMVNFTMESNGELIGFRG